MTLATISQADLDLRILFETDRVVVVDKPWGVPSTGRRLDDPDSLQYALVQRYVSMTWAVHQLDADTSGLNVFVRRRESVASAPDPNSPVPQTGRESPALRAGP